MEYILWGLTGLSLVTWIGLLLGRGLFWCPAPRLRPPRAGEGMCTNSVVAVIPARDEAKVLPDTLPTVLAQDYRGTLRAILVDDRSKDETRHVASSLGDSASHEDRLTVFVGEPLPQGWSGKVWAMSQGVAEAGQPEFLWLTDADIAHEPWVLTALVNRAESEHLDLVSTMATLRIKTMWDRLLVPAFVYFFAKLYPFRFVGNPHRRDAGAAGGCILVRRSVLEDAGGLSAIRAALIDDCALGRLIKNAGGRLWLGFSRGVRSVRDYGSLASVWRMVARSAYTQLGYSPLKLGATVVGMLFLYALPPAACIGGTIATIQGLPGSGPIAIVGGVTWAMMAGSFIPLLRHHAVGGWVAPLLPIAGVLYVAMTISSACQHAKGHGGSWKGRTYSAGDS